MGREAETEMKKGHGGRGREGEEIKEVEGERLALGEKDGTRFKIVSPRFTGAEGCIKRG